MIALRMRRQRLLWRWAHLKLQWRSKWGQASWRQLVRFASLDSPDGRWPCRHWQSRQLRGGLKMHKWSSRERNHRKNLLLFQSRDRCERGEQSAKMKGRYANVWIREMDCVPNHLLFIRPSVRTWNTNLTACGTKTWTSNAPTCPAMAPIMMVMRILIHSLTTGRYSHGPSSRVFTMV